MDKIQILVALTLLAVGWKISNVGGQHGGGHAHSFAHFHGPVVGPDKLIVFSGGHGGREAGGGGHGSDEQGGSGQAGDEHGAGGHVAGSEHVDYVGHPKYDFSYGVVDPKTGDTHGQKEMRDGQDVVGEYIVKEPGGNTRTVKYYSDKHGFHADVHNSNGNYHSGGGQGGQTGGGHGGHEGGHGSHGSYAEHHEDGY